MTYEEVVAWITSNYGPSDFGISEELVRDKLSTDGRYTFDEEINDARNILLSENDKFSSKLLDKIYTKTAFRDSLVFSEIDIERIRSQATEERTKTRDVEKIINMYESGMSLTREQKNILRDEGGINVDF